MRLIGLILLTTYVAASPLVGSNQCTWGPSYWCSHISHAKECGAVQHCIQTVWENQRIEVESDETCTYCMLLVGELRSALENKATQDEIAEKIADACELLPAGEDRDVCKGIVTDDFPIVMQLLLSKITPSMVCNVVGFCSVPDKVIAPVTTKTTALTTTHRAQTPCDDCMKFIEDVQDAVTSNETVSQLEQIIHGLVCQNLGSFAQECDDLVKQLLPDVLAFLADQINPDIFCRIIGFCASDQELPFKIPLNNVFANRPPVPLKYQSSEECEICKDIMTQIVDLLRDKTQQDKVKYLIENDVCTLFGSFTGQCKLLVEEYFPQLVELLVNELDPTTVCETVGLCKVPGLKINMLAALKLVPAKPISNSIECEICEEIAKQLDDVLKQNETVQTLEDLVEKVCKRLPDEALIEKCEGFVQEYGKLVLHFLLGELDPKKLCTELGLCSKRSETVSKSHDIYTKWKDDAKCELCKFVVQQIQDAIANMTSDEIINDLDKVCSFMPGNFSATCRQYVKDYAPFLIDMLRTSEPKVLCGLLKACGTNDTGVPRFMVPIPEDPIETNTGKETVSEICEICNTLVLVLKELVSQNMTEAEIEQLLEEVCSKIPYVSSECDYVVETYGKKIIEYLLKEMDPNTICTEIHACTGSNLQEVEPLLTGILTPLDTLPLQTVHTEPVKGAPKSVSGGDTACDICKVVLNTVDDILAEKYTEEEVRTFLDSLCKDIPSTSLASDCKTFVDTYTPVVINYIVLNLDAEVWCKVMDFCPAEKKVPKLVHVPLMKDNEVMARKLGAKVSDVECDLCKMVMTEVDNILGKNRTEENIISALDKVCDILPSAIKSQCLDFVKEYGKLVINLLLQEMDPETICKTLGLCSQSLKPLVASVHLIPGKDSAKSVMARKLGAKVSDVECDLCKMVMTEVDNILGENRTEQNIISALDKVCDILPSAIKSQCLDFIKEYGKLVINLLLQEMDPETICKTLGLCSQSLQPLVASVHLIPSKVSPKSGNVGSLECEGCKYIAEMIKKQIGQNKTEEEVEQLLDKLCDLLPDTVTAQCNAIVKQYVPAIMDLLKEEINVTQFCQQIGFCSSSKINKTHKPLAAPDTHLKQKTDDTLYFKPQGHMLGEDKCTYGPAFWCKNEENAKKCNAWEHCSRHVWNRS